MARKTPSLPVAGLAVLLAVLAVTSALAAVTAPAGYAQGQGGDRQSFTTSAGPYRIDVVEIVSAISLGQVRMVVTVRDAITGEAVPDARVVIHTAHGSEGRGASAGYALALNGSDAPERYFSQMSLDRPGSWQVWVEVSSSLGQVEVEVPTVVVPQSRRATAGGLVFFGVFAVLILGALYVTWRIRQNLRRRASAHES